MVSIGQLCDLPAGFAVSDNLVTLCDIMKEDVTEVAINVDVTS